MSRTDDRIVGALERNAPPARDAMFRLQVLERRERQQFRRRGFMALFSAIAIALVSALVARAGGADAVGSELPFAFVLIATFLIHTPQFGRLLGSLFRLTSSAREVAQ